MAGLDPSERRSDAEMAAPAEGEMLLRRRVAVEANLVGVVPRFWVTVR